MKIGIDLGGSHVGVGLVDRDKIIKSKDKNFTLEDKKDIQNVIINTILNYIDELLIEENLTKQDIKLIGIASPGIISKNEIVKATNLGIYHFYLPQILEEKLGIKTQIRNDGKCAGLAEVKYGALKDYEDSIFLCLGTGIGGAAFLNKTMLEPSGYSGFEFGHMIIEKDGNQCSCGKKGCFETYASIRVFKKNICDILKIKNDISGQELRRVIAENSNNKKVQAEIERFLHALKIGIGNLIDIFEPEAICFGGSFSYYENNPILEKLVNKINENDTTFTVSKKPDIVLAKYKNEAGIIGATL